MKYTITKTEFLDTGGHCMVLYAEIWLEDERRCVYGATDGESTAIHNTEEDCYDGFLDTSISHRWYQDPTHDEWDDVHATLLREFEILNARDVVSNILGKAFRQLMLIAEGEESEYALRVYDQVLAELDNIIREEPRCF